LNSLGPGNHIFITDDYEAYHQLIPENQLFTGKDLTFPIEQDNSNTRHYLARFRRKSKVTSRSLEMVNLSLILLYHFSQGCLYEGFQDKFLSIFK
jgi:insertion element IS1 protein InsB